MIKNNNADTFEADLWYTRLYGEDSFNKTIKLIKELKTDKRVATDAVVLNKQEVIDVLEHAKQLEKVHKQLMHELLRAAHIPELKIFALEYEAAFRLSEALRSDE